MRHGIPIALFFHCALVALAGNIPPITTTPMTFPGTPSAVTLGSDGNIWLIDRPANKIGKLTPEGAYTAFSIPTPNAIASGITAAPDGNAWFAESGPNKLGKITPDGVVTEFALPSGRSLGNLTAGPDGNVWFTESQSTSNGPVYLLGRLSAADGTFSDFPLPTNGRAQGLVSGSDGNVWIGWVEFSGGKYDVLRVTPDGTTTMFPLPSTGALNALGATMLQGPDGNIWFTYQNNLSRVKPDGTATLYAIPTANANMLPAGLTIGIDGNIWFTEFSSGKIGQLIVRSATDNGQATINESDPLGGLPQTLLVLPTSRRVKGKIGVLDTPHCPSQAFVIQYQPSSTGEAHLLTTSMPAPATCADVAVDIRFSLEESLSGDKRRKFVIEVDNDGPDDAQSVQMTAHVNPKSEAAISHVLPPDPDSGLPPDDCQTSDHEVSCKWPVIKSGKKDFIVMVFKNDSNLPQMTINAYAWSATPDPIPTNNVTKREFRFHPYDWGVNRGTTLPADSLIVQATPSRH